MTWRRLQVSLTELCIDTTLRCGQSFRWKKSSPDTFSCALHGRLISLRQDRTHLYYHATLPPPVTHPDPPASPLSNVKGEESSDAEEEEDSETEAFLWHYLNLGPDLSTLYEAWSSRDKNFRKKAPKFTGVRILKQDAWEALVGFICSSNNNIARISQMMDKLCANYGPLIGHIGDQPYYDMPSPAALTNPRVEGHLRELGFGYRAKYLHQTAVMVTREKEGWLDSLRNPESPPLGKRAKSAGEMLPGGRTGYREAHEKLLALQGVGPKVADCVCLMGLGWGEAVPVDTHVWQIAQRDYKFGGGRNRTLTKATYDAVGDHFRQLWGKEAGWAHSVLFTADLKAFSAKLAAEVGVKEEIVQDGEPSDTVIKTEVSVETFIPEVDESDLSVADDGEFAEYEESILKEAKEEDDRISVKSEPVMPHVFNRPDTVVKQEEVKVERSEPIVPRFVDEPGNALKEEEVKVEQSEPIEPHVFDEPGLAVKKEEVKVEQVPGSAPIPRFFDEFGIVVKREKLEVEQMSPSPRGAAVKKEEDSMRIKTEVMAVRDGNEGTAIKREISPLKRIKSEDAEEPPELGSAKRTRPSRRSTPAAVKTERRNEVTIKSEPSRTRSARRSGRWSRR